MSHEQNAVRKALADLEAARTRDSTGKHLSTEWYYIAIYADALYEAGCFAEAVLAYERALAIDPGEAGTRPWAEEREIKLSECRRRVK